MNLNPVGPQMAILCALVVSCGGGCSTPSDPATPTSALSGTNTAATTSTGTVATAHAGSRWRYASTNLPDTAAAAESAVRAAVLAQFSYSATNGAVTLTRYRGSARQMAVPDTANSLPVTGIGDGAFSSCASLTNLTIGTNVTGIGEYAFSSCINLSCVTIPPSVTNIGVGAFWGCSGLTNVTILDGVAGIPRYAFCFCGRLRNVAIPASVSNIGVWAFWGCTNLHSVVIPANSRIMTEAFAPGTKLIGGANPSRRRPTE